MQGAGADRAQRVRRVAVTVAMVFVIAVFAVSSRSYSKSWDSLPTAIGFQNLQAEALARGQAALYVNVPAELVALPDPYDPIANRNLRATGIGDLSLYHGRLYSYFGVTPVLLLHLPFHLVTGEFISPSLATFLFISLGFVLLCLAWFELARLLGIRVGVLGATGSVLVLGLGCGLPWLAYIGRSYETVIAAGFAVLAGAIYALLRTMRATGRAQYVWAVLSGAAFGALVGARPQMILAALLPLAATIAILRQGTNRRVAMVGVLWMAFALVIVGILAFNLVRFGNPLQFGNKYQLAGVRAPSYPSYRPSYLKDAIYWYWLAPPRLIGAFPFLTLHPGAKLLDPFVGYSHEGVVGTIPAMPFIPVGVVMGIIAAVRAWKRGIVVPAVVGAAVALFLAGVFVIDGTAFRAATMRYELDYLPTLCLIAVAGAYALWQGQSGQRGRVIVAALVVPLASVTILVNLLITRTPCQSLGSC